MEGRREEQKKRAREFIEELRQQNPGYSIGPKYIREVLGLKSVTDKRVYFEINQMAICYYIPL